MPGSPPLASSDEVQRIAPAEAKALLDRGEAVLYDVRSPDSYAAKHAAGALSLPSDAIESSFSTVPKGKALILYRT